MASAHHPSVVPCPSGPAASCGTGCGRWHDGPQRLLAPTPRVLMNSRYSNVVLGMRDYLLDS
jgi:SEC-C motif-containing protein